MIVNGNYYQQPVNGNIEQESTNHIESLETHLRETKGGEAKAIADSVQLSEEAYAALKEYAPEALDRLDSLGYIQKDNRVLEEIKEIAKEKYFHFGSEYITIPKTEEEMLSALDVANRYIDALNSIEPDEIYEAIAGANRDGASGSMADVSAMRDIITA